MKKSKFPAQQIASALSQAQNGPAARHPKLGCQHSKYRWWRKRSLSLLAAFDRLQLVKGAVGANGNRVAFMNALSFTSTSATGFLDEGIDGPQDTPDARATFQAVGLGTTILEAGTGDQWDVVVLPPDEGTQPAEQSITFAIQVVPEPGTALLQGLGFAGLAISRRRA